MPSVGALRHWPFYQDYRPRSFDQVTYRGVPADLSMRVALAQADIKLNSLNLARIPLPIGIWPKGHRPPFITFAHGLMTLLRINIFWNQKGVRQSTLATWAGDIRLFRYQRGSAA